MSKFRQKFTREQVEYKLDEKTDRLVMLDEKTNLQELVNSHYDETLYYNLERYFLENAPDPKEPDDTIIDDLGIEGTKADRMLGALQRVQDLRAKYSIPDVYSDMEVLQYLREKAAADSASSETVNEGGENDETKTEPPGEQA